MQSRELHVDDRCAHLPTYRTVCLDRLDIARVTNAKEFIKRTSIQGLTMIVVKRRTHVSNDGATIANKPANHLGLARPECFALRQNEHFALVFLELATPQHTIGGILKL